MTLFVGENGSGKSTLIEAIAVARGLQRRGRQPEHRCLDARLALGAAQHLRLVRGARRPRRLLPARGELLQRRDAHRALDERRRPPIIDAYGGRRCTSSRTASRSSRSSTNRFGADGLYLLDEPEAALSLRGYLALMRRMHELVAGGSQFIVATHSPILLGYPGARIYVLSRGRHRRDATRRPSSTS